MANGKHRVNDSFKIVRQEWSYRALETDEWITETIYFIKYFDYKIYLYRYEVHVVQNLYFALTGKELELTDKKQ